MSDQKTCKTCNHNQHKAGYCDKCNCGESQMVKTSGVPYDFSHGLNGGQSSLAFRRQNHGRRKLPYRRAA